MLVILSDDRPQKDSVAYVQSKFVECFTSGLGLCFRQKTMEGTGTKRELFWNQRLRPGISTRQEEEDDNNSGALWKLNVDGIERKRKRKEKLFDSDPVQHQWFAQFFGWLSLWLFIRFFSIMCNRCKNAY